MEESSTYLSGIPINSYCEQSIANGFKIESKSNNDSCVL
jgi:hypothetical protein